MTATTVDRNTPSREKGWLCPPVAADAVIFAGTIVCINSDGFAVAGATDPDLIYLGRAQELVDNTGGLDGAVNINVRRDEAFQWENDATHPVVQASLGSDCYVVDNQTVAATDGTGTRSRAGRVIAIDNNGIWVE